ncbi:MAG: 50S ribosomal protein L25/general stress protein Ctc [Luminiphilus sp.]|nr:50S ribosomal protein L25/general stress protein Ctc [Luminiphilus sp.]
MSESFEVQAEVRVDEGKGASRRLRRLEGKVPGVVYGGQAAARSISLIRKDLEKMLENEAFYTSVLNVLVDGDTESAILKDVQRHPAKGFPMHVDFLRVQADKVLKVNVPLHFTNEESCQGVKLGGGMVQHQATDMEVQCLPGDIPDYIEVDMTDVELGQIVHLSDVTLPEGVVSTALALGEDHDLAIAAVIAPKGSKADDEAAEEAEAPSEGEEPEAEE